MLGSVLLNVSHGLLYPVNNSDGEDRSQVLATPILLRCGLRGDQGTGALATAQLDTGRNVGVSQARQNQIGRASCRERELRSLRDEAVRNHRGTSRNGETQ